jgi:hypothetical protein
MATNPVYPEKPQQTEEKIPVVRIGDLTVLRLPDGAADIIVGGPEPYVVLFEKHEVFGLSIAVVSKGHNIFVPQDDLYTDAYFFRESEAVRFLSPGITAATGPIVVPPKGGPRMPQLERR